MIRISLTALSNTVRSLLPIISLPINRRQQLMLITLTVKTAVRILIVRIAVEAGVPQPTMLCSQPSLNAISAIRQGSMEVRGMIRIVLTCRPQLLIWSK
jgi:hypothetical protein